MGIKNKGYNSDGYSLFSFSIPVRSELLRLTDYSYEAAIVLNQILYFYESKTPKSKLNLYQIKRITRYPKTPQTLRKVLAFLQNRNIILKSGKVYELGNYSLNEKFFRPEKEELISLIETKDLDCLDYQSAAIVNFFRHSLLEYDMKTMYISARELKKRLKLDISLSAIRTKLDELVTAKYIKRTLIGRKYNYELIENILLDKGLDVINNLADDLSLLLEKHCKRYGYYVANKNSITFKRMLNDGRTYEDIKHIIAYLCVASVNDRRRYYAANHIAKSFDNLISKAKSSVSKHKKVRVISKLSNGHAIQKFNKSEVPMDNNEIWTEAIGWLETQGEFVYKCYLQNRSLTTTADDGSDYNDFYYELLIAIVSAAVRNKVSPLSFTREYIKKTIKAHSIQKFRSQATDVALDDIIDCAEVEKSSYEPLKYDMKKVPDYLAHIPYEELEVMIKYYNKSNGKETVKELASEYGFSIGKISRVINKTFDEVKQLYYQHGASYS